MKKHLGLLNSDRMFTNLDKSPLGPGPLNNFNFHFVDCNSLFLSFHFSQLQVFCVHEIPHRNLKLFCPSGVQ